MRRHRASARPWSFTREFPRRVFASAAWLAALWTCASLPARAQPVAISRPAGGAHVLWSRPVVPPPPPPVPAMLVARLQAARSPADSLAAWKTVARDSLLRPCALLRIARLETAAGDTARADAWWAALAAERSLWQWEALRARSDLALARGNPARADSLLEGAARDEWPDPERAEWLARRVDLALARGDTASALRLAVQMIAVYPSYRRTPAVLRTLETVRAARGDSLSAEEQDKAWRVDLAAGRKNEALARLSRIPSRRADPALQLQRARLLRELRRFREARERAAAALRLSRSPAETLAVRVERARILRDEGDIPGALSALDQAARRAPGGGADARWERARMLEDRGEWKAARADYARVAELRRRSDEGSMLRAGLMSLAAGEPREARDWFARGSTEAARFWHAVTLRRLHAPSGDSLLLAIAVQPGYGFYRVAARETLRVQGWPEEGVRRPGATSDPGLALAYALDAVGCRDEASTVLARWTAQDPRLARPGARSAGRSSGAWLEGAATAFRAGRPRDGIRFATQAATAPGRGTDSLAWSASPWLYPPAYDALFAEWPDSAGGARVERSLLRAVAWKESGFDPVARSRSDAIGLLQLKRPAVIDVARWLKEPPPSDAALGDPALNLRYGARYLEGMLARFGGDLPLALAAYNAGPTVAKRWTRLRAQGGDALACEEIDYPETQDYVKAILAVRQAYRELKPVFAP